MHPANFNFLKGMLDQRKKSCKCRDEIFSTIEKANSAQKFMIFGRDIVLQR